MKIAPMTGGGTGRKAIDPGLAAMQERLAGAKKNKPMKKPKARAKTVMDGQQ
jgi:hypothetical protein